MSTVKTISYLYAPTAKSVDRRRSSRVYVLVVHRHIPRRWSANLLQTPLTMAGLGKTSSCNRFMMSHGARKLASKSGFTNPQARFLTWGLTT